MGKNIDLEELRKIQLDILIEIDRFCKANQITYWLCGGTLLGAIRHKGYIPWDDDIDISLPRPEYNRFIRLWNQQHSYYRLVAFENDQSYPYLFGKICDTRTCLKQTDVNTPDFGIYVDVFPVDGITKSGWQISYYRGLNFLLSSKRRRLSTCSLGRRIAYALPKLLMSLVSERWMMRNINKMMQQYDYTDAEHVAVICGNYYKNENLPKSCFSKIVKGTFEGIEVPIPNGYDQYLSQLYGDYMKLPPIEKQITHHHFIAYWK